MDFSGVFVNPWHGFFEYQESPPQEERRRAGVVRERMHKAIYSEPSRLPFSRVSGISR